MASVLYYGTDDRIPKMLDQIFQDRLKDTGEASSVLRVTDDKQLGEALIAMAFDVIFCEQTIIPGAPVEWLNSSRKTKPSLKGPLVLVGTETDAVKIFKLIEGGWMDYLLLPPDRALLIEKIYMYSSGKRSSDVRQVYSMTMSQQADIAKPAVVEELSEFDCKMRLASPMNNGELQVLYSVAFSAPGIETPTRMLARCYSCEKHPGFEGQFKASFYFLGVLPDALTNIRNSLRKQFVSGKGKG